MLALLYRFTTSFALSAILLVVASFHTVQTVSASPQSGCTVTIDRITRTETTVKVDLLVQNHRTSASSGEDVIDKPFSATLSSNNPSPGSVNTVTAESQVTTIRPNSTGSATLIFATSGSWSPQSYINITPGDTNPSCTYPDGTPLIGSTQSINTQCTAANGCFEDTTDPDYQGGQALSPECQFINSRRSTTRYTNADSTINYSYQGQTNAMTACKDNRSDKNAGVIFFEYGDEDQLRVYADYTYHSQDNITIGQIHYDCPNSKVHMVIFNSCSNIQEFSTSIYAWAAYAAIFIAIVVYIRGSYMYMTSRGDPSKTAEAKGVFTTASIGLVLVIVALVIVQAIDSSLSGTGWGINLGNFIP